MQAFEQGQASAVSAALTAANLASDKLKRNDIVDERTRQALNSAGVMVSVFLVWFDIFQI